MEWSRYPASRFADFSDDWQRLNACWLDQPIMDADFVTALLRHFFEGDEVLCVGTEEGRVTSMGFFRRIRPLHWATVMPSQAPLGLWLHEAGALRDAEIRGLARTLPGTVLMIDFLQLDSERVARCGRRTFVAQPYIETGRLQAPANFDDYFASLSKNTRQNYRRVNNKAEKAGLPIEVTPMTTRADVVEAVAAYGEIEAESWKAAEGTAVTTNNTQGRFYRDLLTTYAERGGARCWQLRIGGEIAAVDLCIENRGSTVILKTTYAERFREFSPAMQMKFDIIRQLAGNQDGHRRIEFFGKAMEWHRKLTDDIRPLEHVTWFNGAATRRLHQFAKAMRNHPGT